MGYLYKLFPSKSDIMVAAAQRYFERALTRELCQTEAGESYSAYCHRLWEHTRRAFATFMRDWLRDREELPRRDLAAAHTAMASVLAHARAELERVLRRDGRIDWDSMPEGADAPSMAEFTMRSLLDSLKKGDEDCAVLVVLLERGLSPPRLNSSCEQGPLVVHAQVPSIVCGHGSRREVRGDINGTVHS